ncbi:hypothetical protein [Pseudomonas putida]|uniref:hypothetical protein n=1 Tax=Pseudomonas putida TaxID=303 RepID=UPI0039DF36E2
MGRTHTLVEYRLKEYELEQTLRALQEQQRAPDYLMDLEFFEKLSALAKKYDYSYARIFELLKCRYEGRIGKATEISTSIKSKTNADMLDLAGKPLPPHSSSRTSQRGQGQGLYSDAGHEDLVTSRRTSEFGHDMALEYKS